jgi:hypothetical protein
MSGYFDDYEVSDFYDAVDSFYGENYDDGYDDEDDYYEREPLIIDWDEYE